MVWMNCSIFANVFVGSSCVDLHHFDVVLYFIKFLVYHHDFDNESCAGIKPDYFRDTLFSCQAFCVSSCLVVDNRSLCDRVVKKTILLTNMTSAVSTTNLCNL
jgi:hypothetical protein